MDDQQQGLLDIDVALVPFKVVGTVHYLLGLWKRELILLEIWIVDMIYSIGVHLFLPNRVDMSQ